MKILPGHGSGGRLMNELIEKTIRTRLGAHVQLDDAALLSIDGPIVTLVPGNSRCTALAITWAAEWRSVSSGDRVGVAPTRFARSS